MRIAAKQTRIPHSAALHCPAQQAPASALQRARPAPPSASFPTGVVGGSTVGRETRASTMAGERVRLYVTGQFMGYKRCAGERWAGRLAPAARGWRQHAALAARQAPPGGWGGSASWYDGLAARRRGGGAQQLGPGRAAARSGGRAAGGSRAASLCNGEGSRGQQCRPPWRRLGSWQHSPELQSRAAGCKPARRVLRAPDGTQWPLPACHTMVGLLALLPTLPAGVPPPAAGARPTSTTTPRW